MSGPESGERWDAEYRAGKYDFLHKPAERARLAEIARMIAHSIGANGASEVVDIGCGEGLLLGRLNGIGVTRYVGIDVSAVALERLPESTIAVSRVRASLAQWDGRPQAEAQRILVASEVLYYDGATVGDLERAVRASPAVSEVIVSCVAPNPKKPNWAVSSQRIWRELAKTGWRPVEKRHVRDSATAIGWNLARYRV